MAMTRQKIKWLSGDAHVVTLESAGQQVRSQFGGTEYRYDVTEHGTACLMYLPQEAQTKLLRCQALAGDDIRIMKLGSNGHTTWEVQRMADNHLAVQAPPRHQHRPQPAPSASAPPQSETTLSVEDVLVKCFECAGRALVRAHGTLAQTMHLEPPIWEDLRAVGISLFIERNRQRREREGR